MQLHLINESKSTQEGNVSFPVDLIRTVAMVAVILLHAANDLTIQHLDQLEIFRWLTVDVYQSAGRMGVPLFLMLTGALLLQPSKKDTLSVFFKKRWTRIGIPSFFGVPLSLFGIFWLNSKRLL